MRIVAILAAALLCTVTILSVPIRTAAQTGQPLPAPANFRVGERITYTVSFEKFNNAGFVETHVVSRGRIGDKDAVELRSKIKSLDIVSAAFYAVDESRTVFAAADSAVPLHIRRSMNGSVIPVETIGNYLSTPAPGYDLLTLIFKVRFSGDQGTFPLFENEKVYNVTFAPGGGERVATDAGDFETTISTVQSEYLTEAGIDNLRINFSSDPNRIPVLIRFKTAKGDFRVSVTGIHVPERDPQVLPLPTPLPTPKPAPTPKIAATPEPYIDNRELSADLPFKLGEELQYRLSAGAQVIGTFTLHARERKSISGEDTLVIGGTVKTVEPNNGLLAVNDHARAFVNPDTLVPRLIEIKFSGPLSSLNSSAVFDQDAGTIVIDGGERVDAPVGTHSILSLIYALRSFNLKPSKDPNNPVNDTRVAVLWQSKPYVFTLRPSPADILTLQNEKVPAQLVTVNTGNPQMDLLNLRIWLSTGDSRVPLRFSIGAYQADLISQINTNSR